MLGQTRTAMLQGAKALIVTVECDVADGMPGYYMVGYLGNEVKEAKERILSAFRNSGYRILAKKITVNMIPASVHKRGTGFDLPIAVALAMGYGMINTGLEDVIMIGEVALTGEILGVNGLLPMLIAAEKEGYKYCIVPKDNMGEALLIEEMNVVCVANLREVLELLQKSDLKKILERRALKSKRIEHDDSDSMGIIDFQDIKGQKVVKRACEIAACGMHNLLMIGQPGAGKTMIAKAMVGILPELDRSEQLEVTSIYSICGLLGERTRLMQERPFRKPHHKITIRGLIGGGNPVKPGEISLANHGVLFLGGYFCKVAESP